MNWSDLLHVDTNLRNLKVTLIVGVSVVRNGYGSLGRGDLKSSVAQEWCNEMSWFFACC